MTSKPQLETGDGIASALGHPGTPASGHSHTAHFYSSDAVLLAEVCSNLSASLAAGGCAIVIATRAHILGFEQQLTLRGFDMPRIARQGRWLALSAAATLASFMVQGWPDEKKFSAQLQAILDRAVAAASPVAGLVDPHIAAYDEMNALLWEQDNTSAALHLEELWSRVLRTRSFHLSCGWPLRLFSSDADSAAIRRICALHSGVTPAYAVAGDPAHRRDLGLWQLKARAVLQNVSHIARQTLGFYRDSDSVSPAPIAVSSAMDEVIAMHQPRICEREVDVRCKIRSNIDVVAPLGEFKHVLSCLVANALDASSPGDEITISAWKGRHPVTGVPGIRLTVLDQGVGIPDAIVRDVFTPFFTTTRDINIGLGLWVVKDILDRRGGFIRCRSRVTQPSGTVMMVFLPSAPAQAAAA
jgi:signal transduction histidine kinase